MVIHDVSILFAEECAGIDEIFPESFIGHAVFIDGSLVHGKGLLPKAEKPFNAYIGIFFNTGFVTVQKERGKGNPCSLDDCVRLTYNRLTLIIQRNTLVR